jgi:hypothetical protein
VSGTPGQRQILTNFLTFFVGEISTYSAHSILYDDESGYIALSQSSTSLWLGIHIFSKYAHSIFQRAEGKNLENRFIWGSE